MLRVDDLLGSERQLAVHLKLSRPFLALLRQRQASTGLARPPPLRSPTCSLSVCPIRLGFPAQQTSSFTSGVVNSCASCVLLICPSSRLVQTRWKYLSRQLLWLSLQTSIITDGYRSLAEGEEVEFTIEQGNDGRIRAKNVTGPNGAPPQVCSKTPAFPLDCSFSRHLAHHLTGLPFLPLGSPTYSWCAVSLHARSTICACTLTSTMASASCTVKGQASLQLKARPLRLYRFPNTRFAANPLLTHVTCA